MSRRRWVYRLDEETGAVDVQEVGQDWTGAEKRAQTATEELIYGGARATDGADISTRKKHREYMRRNGLTTVDDFKDTWAKAKTERERVRSGKGVGDNAARKEAIGRAMYQLERGARK